MTYSSGNRGKDSAKDIDIIPGQVWTGKDPLDLAHNAASVVFMKKSGQKKNFLKVLMESDNFVSRCRLLLIQIFLRSMNDFLLHRIRSKVFQIGLTDFIGQHLNRHGKVE